MIRPGPFLLAALVCASTARFEAQQVLHRPMVSEPLPLMDASGTILTGGPGAAAAGGGFDVLKSFPVLPASWGLAFKDGSLCVLHSGRVLEVDRCTGALLSSVDLGDHNASGLAWDSKRRYFVVTNASFDFIARYDESGVLVDEYPDAYGGPVGAAYDPSRDGYWISDWGAGRVYFIAPDGGPPLIEHQVGLPGFGGLRLAGTGYDPRSDLLLFHARTTNETYLMRASDGQVVRKETTPGDPGPNNGSGAAFVPGLRAGVVIDQESRLLFELDLDLPVVFDMETDDSFLGALVNGQDIAPGGEFGRLVEVEGLSAAGLPAAIFDSTPGGPNATSSDPDLLVGLGGVLILQEQALQTIPGVFDFPDDESCGGTLEMRFPDLEVAPLSLDLIDICPASSQDASVALVDAAGLRRVYEVLSGWTEDVSVDGGSGYRTLDLTTLAAQPGFLATATATEDPGFSPSTVVTIKVLLLGSGAIDNLVVDPYP